MRYEIVSLSDQVTVLNTVEIDSSIDVITAETPGAAWRPDSGLIARKAPVEIYPGPSADDLAKRAVNDERDRRIRQFTFNGKSFDFCDGKGSDINISGAGTLALAAISDGAAPNDLRWADPSSDFTWIAADNSTVTMDAFTCLTFAKTAAAWKAGHIRAARLLKDTSPIPANYADNQYWP